MSDPVPGFRPPETPRPRVQHESIQVERSMRVGPLAAGVGVGVIILVAATSLLPLWNNSPTTATPAPASTPSATGRPTSATTPTLTGPLTLQPAPGASSSPTPSRTPSRSRSATPTPSTASPSATPTDSAGPSPTASRYPDVRGFRECTRSGTGPYAAVGTGNESTSCGFAINVWNAYLKLGINGGNGTILATSPVTHETYRVRCSGSQPALCTGGESARVLIYGGRLV